MQRVGDTGEAIATLFALQDDDAVAKAIGIIVGELAGRWDKTPRETIEILLTGGAFDPDDWNAAKSRRVTNNARKLYAGAAVLLQPKRPQG